MSDVVALPDPAVLGADVVAAVARVEQDVHSFESVGASGRGEPGDLRCVVRLMTPRRLRYEDAYARAYPFDRLVDGMQDPLMVEQTVQLMHAAIREKTQINIIVNNRAGGNAPFIARQIAERFLESLDRDRGAIQRIEYFVPHDQTSLVLPC